MLEKMKVWEVVALPKNQRTVSLKWVFANKLNTKGEVIQRESRLVVQGFSQQAGVDFKETFTPTACLTSLMIMFLVAVKKRWHIRGFDIVSAYPHSLIDEKIYVKPPDGFIMKDTSMVLLLKKALYGTKQAARCWWKDFSMVLMGMGCKYCVNDQSFYVLHYKGCTALL